MDKNQTLVQEQSMQIWVVPGWVTQTATCWQRLITVQPVGVCSTKVREAELAKMCSQCVSELLLNTRKTEALAKPVGSTINIALLSTLATLLFASFHMVISQCFRGPICCFAKAILFIKVFTILNCEANRIHCPCKSLLQCCDYSCNLQCARIKSKEWHLVNKFFNSSGATRVGVHNR